MSVDTVLASLDRDASPQVLRAPSRVLVTWQDPETRNYHPVGFLTDDGHEYQFAYLARAVQQPRFHGLLGFGDVRRVYRSQHLFPIFAQRVFDPRRADGPQILDALDLDVAAGPLEILARSGGRRSGDTLEILPEPLVRPDGSTTCQFLVHGVRHQAGASQRIGRLIPGARLGLIHQTENTSNPLAILVTHDHQPLGWVPDPLVSYVHDVRHVAEPEVAVQRVNPPEYGHHLRLLVRFSGTVAPGYEAFSGPEWATAAD